MTDGTPYDVTITGDLTVRDVTAPVTLDATVTCNADALDIDATTTVKLPRPTAPARSRSSASSRRATTCSWRSIWSPPRPTR
ncbi:MAG: YceI family protein [Acidimicrobiales bacterium]